MLPEPQLTASPSVCVLILLAPHKYIELIRECPAEHHDTIPFARVRVFVIFQVSDIAERSHTRAHTIHIPLVFAVHTLARVLYTISVRAQAQREVQKKTTIQCTPTAGRRHECMLCD